MPNRLSTNVFSVEFWRSVWQDIQLSWRLLRDPRVPLRLKAIPFLVGIYLLSPFDLIGFIPIIGQLDDLAILVLGIRLFIRLTPQQIVQENRKVLS